MKIRSKVGTPLALPMAGLTVARRLRQRLATSSSDTDRVGHDGRATDDDGRVDRRHRRRFRRGGEPEGRLPRHDHDPDRLEPGGRARLPVPVAGAEPDDRHQGGVGHRRARRQRRQRHRRQARRSAPAARRSASRRSRRSSTPTTTSCSATSTPTRRSRTPTSSRPSRSSSGFNKNPQMIMWDPATYPDVKTHRRPRQDQGHRPLLQGRCLHGLLHLDRHPEQGPGRRLLRRHAGAVHRRPGQGRPAGLRLR